MGKGTSDGWSGYDAYSTTATSAATTTEEHTDVGRAVFICDPERNEQFEFPNNRIRTSHYTVFTFLPLTLYEQFRKLPNAYFLVMASLTLIPTISPIHPWSSFMPLVFVVTVSMIREFIEDYFRHRQDNEINNRKVTLLDIEDSEWREDIWINVMPGDIVLVQDGEFLPADLMVLSTSTDDGSCTVETRNLDGESNLKPKKAVDQTQALGDDLEAISRISGSLHYERPNNRLYAFNGSLEYAADKDESSESIPVTAKEILLRGSMLKGTKWIIGFTVFTGKETKLMMNATKTKTKRSRVDKLMTKYLVVILIFEFLVVFSSAVAAGLWQEEVAKEHLYLALAPDDDSAFYGFKSFFTFFILLSALIPISLYVSVEMVKVVLALQINVDKDMYYAETSKPARARTSNLAEELGQVKYVFSDKTGTLTQNRMDFIKCSIGGVSYGTGVTEAAKAAKLRAEGKDAAQLDWHELEEESSATTATSMSSDDGAGGYTPTSTETSSTDEDDDDTSDDYDGETGYDEEDEDETTTEVSSSALEAGRGRGRGRRGRRRNGRRSGGTTAFDPRMLAALDEEDDHAEDIDLFITLLAVCNTVDPRKAKENEAHHFDVFDGIRYQAASPDEAALVKAAAEFFGYRMLSRSGPKVTVDVRGEKRVYKILNVLEFDSDRKRMSVVVRMPDGRILCLTKGADSVIYKLVDNADSKIGHATDKDLTTYSEEGLRTLACAYREVSSREYKAWAKRYKEAALDVFRRDELIAEVSADMETGLTLLGATGIEDKLQAGVPRTIATLAHANIKIWVLTGDKQETAINIGYACALLDQHMNILVVNTDSFAHTMKELRKLVAEYTPERNAAKGRFKNNALVMDGATLGFVLSAPEAADLLYELGLMCVSVIFCRVSPLQKAQVVGLVRERAPHDVTLAIGDGANDVSMITEAHVGVGISGEEGMQAVLASDFAFGQFRYLQKLLLVHGRWSYRRVVKLILYSFYKNFAFNLTQLWFNIFAGMSGQTLIDEWYISVFNLTFTGLPIMVFAVFDQDVNSRGSQLFPQLYSVGQNDELFNLPIFVAWLVDGFFQSLVLFFVPAAVFLATATDDEGRVSGLYHLGALMYVCIVIVVNLKVMQMTKYWTWMSPIVYWGSIAAWFAFAAIYHAPVEWGTKYGLTEFLEQRVTWLVFVIVSAICLLPAFVFEYVQVNFYPTKVDVVRGLQITRNKGDLSEEAIGHIEAALAAHQGDDGGAPTGPSSSESGSTRWESDDNSPDSTSQLESEVDSTSTTESSTPVSSSYDFEDDDTYEYSYEYSTSYDGDGSSL